MKRVLISLFAFGALAEPAFAGCHDKCVIRNPFSGNCAYEVRVCPLSTETIGHWVDGATPDTISQAFADIDPTKALAYYAKHLGVNVNVTDAVTGCFVDSAAIGILGTVCAAGVAEVGALCLADVSCTASCVGTGQAFKNLIEDCGGQ